MKEALPDVTARRRLWEDVLAGVLDARTGPAQAVIDGRTAEADAALLRLPRRPRAMPRHGAGEAWLVGAGPGDPGLITVRGLHCLQHADVVLHDRLVAPALLAFARRDAELIDVGKTGGGAVHLPGRTSTSCCVARVRAGQRVCRLKGGDPYVFGRGSEEALALAAAGLPFQVDPRRHGRQRLRRLRRHSAHAPRRGPRRDLRDGAPGRPGDEPARANRTGSGSPPWARRWSSTWPGGASRRSATRCCRHGRPADTPAAVVMGGTTDDQRVVAGTLGDIAGKAAAAGRVVAGDPLRGRRRRPA